MILIRVAQWSRPMSRSPKLGRGGDDGHGRTETGLGLECGGELGLKRENEVYLKDHEIKKGDKIVSSENHTLA
jgi:hypothetical protein